MLFNSIEYLIFFPVVLIVNFLLPKKVRYIWLLIASYFFYMCWDAKYSLLILFSTVVTYLCGIFLDSAKTTTSKKVILAISLVLNFSILIYFKYLNYFIELLNRFFSAIKFSGSISTLDLLLPVGISFYTFQAVGYTIDVYRGDIEPERNFLKYALFVSFFPQLVAGPIERSKNLINQLNDLQDFSLDNAREGILIMVWGFFLKIVVADRIALFVDTVYYDYEIFTGWFLIVATVLFAIQVYCDFAGYSLIAIGSAKMFGVQLMDNFDAPYLSTSVSQFWRRWHISLTSWFKDYLYIPLGGSRHGKVRKYINQMIVFLVSGLWHGANGSYVIWGGLNGIYQIIEDLLNPIKKKKSSDKKAGFLLSVINGIITFILIDFTWIFFRAKSVSHALGVIKSIFSSNNFNILFDGSLLRCGLDAKDFNLLIIALLVMFIADILKRKGVVVHNVILSQNYWIRWLVVIFSILAVLIFGKWGPAYNAQNFIYFQF